MKQSLFNAYVLIYSMFWSLYLNMLRFIWGPQKFGLGETVCFKSEILNKTAYGKIIEFRKGKYEVECVVNEYQSFYEMVSRHDITKISKEEQLAISIMEE